MSFGFSELPREPESSLPSLASLCVDSISNYVRIWFASKLLDDLDSSAAAQTEQESGEDGGFFLSDSEESEEELEINALTIRTPQLISQVDDTFDDLARILTGEQKGRILSIVAQKSEGFGFAHAQPWVNSLAAEADVLDFTACARMETDVLRCMLTSGGPLPLVSLNVSKCGTVLSPALLAEAAPFLPHLRELRLSGGYTAAGPADAALMRVAVECPNLRLLDVATSHIVGDAAVREILAKARCLETLDISGCKLITDDAFSTPVASTSLKVLKVWGCRLSDVTMEHLSKNSSGLALEHLSALGTFISGSGLLQLPQPQALQSLELGELDISDQELHCLTASAGGLQLLDLSWCDALSDQGLLSVAAHCPLLSSLNLRKSCISDSALKAIGANCSLLQRLGVALCEQIGDEGIEAVCAGCGGLRVLDISWCAGLSARGLMAVMRSLSQLTALSLQGCKPVEDAHLEAAASSLVSLRLLSVAWCNRPSAAGIVALTTAIPALSVYDYYHIRHDGMLVTDAGKSEPQALPSPT